MDEFSETLNRALKAQPKREVFSFEHAGERFWIKRGRAAGSNLLQRAAWRLTRFPLLIPALQQSPLRSLRYESGKLRRLQAEGIPVPDVLLVADGYFVMTDRGPSLREVLREPSARSPKLFLRLFGLLGELHRAGEYHGASQIKNFTVQNGEIFLIDFEEKFPEEIPLEILQLRDLFLLLFSMAKDRHAFSDAPLLENYIRASGNDWAPSRLKELGRKLSFAEKIVAFPPLWKILDKDSKAVYRLLQEIRKL